MYYTYTNYIKKQNSWCSRMCANRPSRPSQVARPNPTQCTPCPPGHHRRPECPTLLLPSHSRDSPRHNSGHAVVVVADPRHLHLRLRRRRGHREGARTRPPQALPRLCLRFRPPPPPSLPHRAAGRAAPPGRPRRLPPPLRVLPPNPFPLLHTVFAILRGLRPPLARRPRRW